VTRLSRLSRADRGSATVEFALASLFLFGIIMVGLDFGIYTQQNLKLGSAVEQGGVIAFSNRAGTVDTGAITNYVTAVAGGAPTMTYQCNGGTCGGATTSKCIGAMGANGWPTFTAPSSGTACSGGGVAGYYMVIRAAKAYKSVVVPDRYLNGSTMQQQAVVRLS
jgi:Flp pilus assembly protein TadG